MLSQMWTFINNFGNYGGLTMVVGFALVISILLAAIRYRQGRLMCLMHFAMAIALFGVVMELMRLSALSGIGLGASSYVGGSVVNWGLLPPWLLGLCFMFSLTLYAAYAVIGFVLKRRHHLERVSSWRPSSIRPRRMKVQSVDEGTRSFPVSEERQPQVA